MTNHPSRKKRRAPRANLERVIAFADHGEELLIACKALLADIEAGYGSIDALPNNVKGVRLMGKVLGDIRRAHEAIAKIEPASCDDCPPFDYATDATRCTPCPRRANPMPDTSCMAALATNKPCHPDETLRRCTICGFIVDTKFKAHL